MSPDAASEAVAAAPTEDDDDAETVQLVERVLELHAKLQAIGALLPEEPGKGSVIPGGAIAVAFTVYQEEYDDLMDRLRELHPPGAGRPIDVDWDYADEFLAQWCMYEIRGLGVEAGGVWDGDEAMARRMAPARRRGYVEAEQLDLDRWRFTLTQSGGVALGVLAP